MCVLLFFVVRYICTYIRMCVVMHVRTYVQRTYGCSYLTTSVHHTYVQVYVHTCGVKTWVLGPASFIPSLLRTLPPCSLPLLSLLCQVLLNMAYALVQLGREKEAILRLEEAYKASLETGEQRHQVVKTALDAARVCAPCMCCVQYPYMHVLWGRDGRWVFKNQIDIRTQLPNVVVLFVCAYILPGGIYVCTLVDTAVSHCVNVCVLYKHTHLSIDPVSPRGSLCTYVCVYAEWWVLQAFQAAKQCPVL